MNKKIDPKVFKETRKDIASVYLNPPFWIVVRKVLMSIDFSFEYSPTNIPNEKKRLKNRQKRKRKRKK